MKNNTGPRLVNNFSVLILSYYYCRWSRWAVAHNGRDTNRQAEPYQPPHIIHTQIMIRSRVSSARRSAGRGLSSSRYSDKSDNTFLTPLIDDSSSYTSDSEDESTTSAESSYEGVPDEKPSFFQLAKLAVGEYDNIHEHSFVDLPA